MTAMAFCRPHLFPSRTTLPCLVLWVIPVFLSWVWRAEMVFKQAMNPSKSWVSEERDVFNGIASQVTFEVPAGVRADVLMAQAWAEFDLVARVANAFDADSEVGRLNAAFKVGAREVSSELFDLLEQSLWASRATDGAFDVTVWPLERLWREAADQGRWPAPSEVAAVLARVGWFRVHLSRDPRTATFDVPDMALDFGGVAKGWAVDRVARLLERAGVRSYLVRCGGEVAALGLSPRGEPWTIGVRHPFRPTQAVGVISGPARLSVSTSGPTEQPLRVGERLVHHILDPRTGWPAPVTEVAVTVVIVGDSPRTALADALSTALSVLGPARGLTVLKSLPGAHALFLEPGADGRLRSILSEGSAAVYRANERQE